MMRAHTHGTLEAYLWPVITMKTQEHHFAAFFEDQAEVKRDVTCKAVPKISKKM